MSALVVSRVFAGPDRGRTLWASFFVGVFVYLLLVLYVGIFSGLDNFRGNGKIWDDYLGRPIFKLLHGESVFFTNRQGLRDVDFQSFLMWIHMPLAVVASMISSSVAMLLTRGK